MGTKNNLLLADAKHIVDCVNRTHRHDYRFTHVVDGSGAWIFACDCGDDFARFGERRPAPEYGTPYSEIDASLENTQGIAT